jgi:hypothetical protein
VELIKEDRHDKVALAQQLFDDAYNAAVPFCEILCPL